MTMWSRRAFIDMRRSYGGLIYNGRCTLSIIQQHGHGRHLSNLENPSAPKKWLLRPSTLNDKDDVRILLTRTYKSVMPRYYSAEILSKCLPVLCEPQDELLQSGTWYVAHDPSDPQRLVGCGGWLRERLERINEDKLIPPADTLSHAVLEVADHSVTAYLRQFAIDPSYTGLGVASAIWKRTLKDVEAITGEANPKLEVFSSFNAERFYKGLGFETIAKTTLPFSDDAEFPVLLMRRHIV